MTTNNPTDEEDLEPKNRLRRIVDKTEQVSNQNSTKSLSIAEQNQQVTDSARLFKNVLDAYPDNEPFPNIEENFEHWERLLFNSERFSDDLDQLSLVSVVTSASTATGYSSDTTSVIRSAIQPSFENHEPLNSAIDEYDRHFSTLIDEDRLISKMTRFRLDEPQAGEISPVEQVRTAFKALKLNVGASDPPNAGAKTLLLPMRQAIDRTLDYLCDLRSSRSSLDSSISPKKRRKIFAIGEQLKKDGIDETQLDLWAEECVELQKTLSAKNDAIDREEWVRLIHRAAQFLEGLLEGLDPTKIIEKAGPNL